MLTWTLKIFYKQFQIKTKEKNNAVAGDRTRDLQIFSLTLSQLSYSGGTACCFIVDGTNRLGTAISGVEKNKKVSLEGLEPPIF